MLEIYSDMYLMKRKEFELRFYIYPSSVQIIWSERFWEACSIPLQLKVKSTLSSAIYVDYMSWPFAKHVWK